RGAIAVAGELPDGAAQRLDVDRLHARLHRRAADLLADAVRRAQANVFQAPRVAALLAFRAHLPRYGAAGDRAAAHRLPVRLEPAHARIHPDDADDPVRVLRRPRLPALPEPDDSQPRQRDARGYTTRDPRDRPATA